MQVKHLCDEEALNFLQGRQLDYSKVPQFSLAWLKAVISLKKDKLFLIICVEGDKLIAYLPIFKFEGNLGAVLQSNPYPAGYSGINIVDEFIELKDVKAEIFSKIFSYITSNDELIKNAILCTIVTHPFNEDIDLYHSELKPDCYHQKLN